MILKCCKKQIFVLIFKGEVIFLHEKILSNLVIKGFRLASTMYNAGGQKIKRTYRKCWAMILRFEGETEYYNNGNTYISNSNNAVILPSGSVYDWVCTKSGHYSIVEFDADFTYSDILSFPIRDSEKLYNAFKEIEYKQSIKSPLHSAEMIRSCYGILIMFSMLSTPRNVPDDKQKKIAPALDYIIKNYNTDISNELLAGLTGLSTVYFRKLFKEIKGEPPIAFARRLRIEKAMEMLKSDYGLISEVAFSLGYQNIFDFSRDFKKHTGISPTQYSKNKKTS